MIALTICKQFIFNKELLSLKFEIQVINNIMYASQLFYRYYAKLLHLNKIREISNSEHFK